VSRRGSSEPRLRGLTEEDLDEVMAIENGSFVRPWTKRLFEETLRSDVSEGLGLESEGRVVGYIVFYAVEGEAHVLNFAVHPLFRRQGLGLTMLKGALKGLRGRGVTVFFLEVREGNAGAIGLYEKCGFERIGRRKRYYSETNEDALVMRCAANGDMQWMI
jgi:[ribosomal protein S18]-alanine N-acetyltransferase